MRKRTNNIRSGDSYSGTGFDSSGPHPSPGNPFGNPDYPGHTTAGLGQVNWIDILVHDRAPANTLCYNFAWTGATVTRSPGDPPVGSYYTFTDQVEEFQQVESATSWNGNNSLIVSWFGVNDIALNTLFNIKFKNDASSANGYNGVASPYFEQLSILYDAGARDFLILDVPPIDRAPTAVDKGNDTVWNVQSNITAFNQVLRNQAHAFLSAHSGSKISFLNTTQPFSTVLDNPEQHGARSATCWNSDGHSCLWTNGEHPAVAIHQAVSEAAFDQLNDLGFWKGMYSAGPIESQMRNAAAARSTFSTMMWVLVIFTTGFISGRFTSNRKTWTFNPKYALG